MDVSFSLPTISDAISDIAASFLCKWIFSTRIVGRSIGCAVQALLRRGFCLWLSVWAFRLGRELGWGPKKLLDSFPGALPCRFLEKSAAVSNNPTLSAA